MKKWITNELRWLLRRGLMEAVLWIIGCGLLWKQVSLQTFFAILVLMFANNLMMYNNLKEEK